ncbi:MAG: hypothetical protein ISS33_06790 [Candidatus Omnitrophica bacterium]|nr:hypothetical protein [Candidatus Omnitrophota bacterium]
MVANLKKITPEEKLLHLIENSGNDQKKTSLKKTVGKKKKIAGFKPVNFSTVFSGVSFSKISIKKIGFRTVNKILIGISLVLTIVFLVQWGKEKAIIQKGFDAINVKPAAKESDRLKLQPSKTPTESAYIAATEKNNPFHLLPVQEKPEITEITLATEFKLVGILWSDQAQAIIEDATTEQTYMVSVGDPLDKYTVSEITKTEVILHGENGDKILQ